MPQTLLELVLGFLVLALRFVLAFCLKRVIDCCLLGVVGLGFALRLVLIVCLGLLCRSCSGGL